MSSFNGQMKEYTRIAIDRFEGKNLHCTAFFLSHCHKDHMMGLNSSSLVDRLSMRDGIFLYCSEITRLLLLAEKNYNQLIDYICVLKIGVPQPVRVPSNNKLMEEYYVTVTAISAGHCPGSVMFLFEGHEGTCLYTGDFRWEINHAAGVAAFKQENRLKHIQSIYVDTTFCIPEAYHIPKRSECVDAALALVTDWLQRSSLNVVLIFCPARYGHEHLLMELSKRLNVKIHVPEWKVKIYDQIPDLKNVFTSDSRQARIHACAAKMGYASYLPCLSNPGEKKFSVLKLRPSTMWFTSEKSKSKTNDLIVTPVSQRGLYRICYSMHSSYSEIRDLVSYLQPEHVFPNVIPMSDSSREAVQGRLNNFQKHFNKARALPSVVETQFQPLGILRKVVTVHTGVQKPSCKQDAVSSDELVFSSQETNPDKVLLQGVNKSLVSIAHLPLQDGAEKLQKSNNSNLATDESSSLDDDVCNSSTSQPHSSYKGTIVSDEEFKLFSDNRDNEKMSDVQVVQTIPDNCDNKKAEDSLRIYISGDSDSDFSDDLDGNLQGYYDTDALTAYSSKYRHNIPEVNDTFVDKCDVSQSTFASLIDLQKSSKTDDISSDCASCQVLETCSGCQDSSKKFFNKQKDRQMVKNIKKTTFSNTGSETVKSASQYSNHIVSEKNKIESSHESGACLDNIYQDQNEKGDDNYDIVYSSQVTSPAALVENQVNMKITFPYASTIFGQFDNISTSHDELGIEKVTKTIASSSSKYANCNSKATVVYSSDESQNTPEQESQTLWSVSYSLDHFTSSKLFLKKTDNGKSNDALNLKRTNEFAPTEPKGNLAEQLDCSNTIPCEGDLISKESLSLDLISKESLSLSKVKAIALNFTEHYQHPCLQNSQFNVNRKKKKLKNCFPLKRKCTMSSNNANKPNEIKRFRNGRIENGHSVFIKQLADTKDDSVIHYERVTHGMCSYSLQEASDSECSDRNSVKFQSKDTLDKSQVKSKDISLLLSHCKPVHNLNSEDSHKHTDGNIRQVSTQNIQISQNSVWVDLTVELSDDVIDLTLESSQ